MACGAACGATANHPPSVGLLELGPFIRGCWSELWSVLCQRGFVCPYRTASHSALNVPEEAGRSPFRLPLPSSSLGLSRPFSPLIPRTSSCCLSWPCPSPLLFPCSGESMHSYSMWWYLFQRAPPFILRAPYKAQRDRPVLVRYPTRVLKIPVFSSPCIIHGIIR